MHPLAQRQSQSLNRHREAAPGKTNEACDLAHVPAPKWTSGILLHQECIILGVPEATITSGKFSQDMHHIIISADPAGAAPVKSRRFFVCFY